MEKSITVPRSGNSGLSVRYMVQMAVLIAIQFILEFANIGYIKTPGLEFTIMQVPVIIGAIVMGPLAGGILGGVFGFTSFWQCFGKSQFGVVLMGISPVGTFLTCVPTRILMGVLCGLLFKVFVKLDRTKGQLFAFGGASLLGALLNTIFFTGTMTAFFYHAPIIQGLVQGFEAVFAMPINPLLFVVFFVGIQGLLEALVCTLSGTAIARALYQFMKR